MSTAESLSRYVELQELGQGAQGRVVLARYTESSELVAIKFLAPNLLRDERQVNGFRREAELLAKVRHPHVAQVREYLQTGAQAAIVMEAINGVSLQQVLKQHGRLTIEASLAVLKGSLLGLDAAHQMGIVHRDYKPANVMVQEDGQSKLIDFGVATLAGERSMSGTPAYMAPEQWRREEATPATDVYAATCVFYECVTGHSPFRSGNLTEMAACHLQKPAPLQELPEELRDLVAAGMAKDPMDRPSRALVFVGQLERVAADIYGSDWEPRGLAALASGAVSLAALFPLSLLAFGSGSAQAGTSTASTVLSGGTGKTGWLTKIGGGKTAAVGAGALATGTACWLMLSGPDVGGASTASYEQWFHNASLVTGNPSIPVGSKAGPGTRYRLSVTPARVTHGTRVTLRVYFEARATWGLEYLSENIYRCHDPNSNGPGTYHRPYTVGMGGIFTGEEFKNADTEVWLYPGGRSDRFPSGDSTLKIPAKLTSDKKDQLYRYSECAWIFPVEGSFTFHVPHGIEPGVYLLSAYSPPGRIDSAKLGSTPIPLETAGLRTEGRLPKLTVLG
ncbi:serine/threonine-protein kinase [Actinocorallia sp. B10E7]|uniref:serine/threonine-protein kinase n=1 Tax=Actinocorallia sp. B10E7 TaxID=3153558 RepID=UPI00325D5F99